MEVLITNGKFDPFYISGISRFDTSQVGISKASQIDIQVEDTRFVQKERGSIGKIKSFAGIARIGQPIITQA